MGSLETEMRSPLSASLQVSQRHIWRENSSYREAESKGIVGRCHCLKISTDAWPLKIAATSVAHPDDL